MASSTIFKNFTVPVEKKSLLLVGKDIISDKYKTEVEEIRNLVSRLLEREREIQLRLEGQVGELRQKLLTLQKGRQAFRGYIKHDGASG